MIFDLPTMSKGHYPFRLACPSFIYPAGYADNVRRLAASVDEIELLLLESAPESLPRPSEISELASLAAAGNIVYNIHLPTDIFPGSDRMRDRSAAVDALLRAIDRVRPLSPVSYTLHLPWAASSGEPVRVAAWQDRAGESIERLLSASSLPAGRIALETLDYPVHYLDPVRRRSGCSLCLDTGHLMARGLDCRPWYRSHRTDIAIMHLHGVSRGRDHLPLDRLSPAQTREIGLMLRDFRASVSLEVFSRADLSASLIYLDKIWHHFSESEND